MIEGSMLQTLWSMYELFPGLLIQLARATPNTVTSSLPTIQECIMLVNNTGLGYSKDARIKAFPVIVIQVQYWEVMKTMQKDI